MKLKILSLFVSPLILASLVHAQNGPEFRHSDLTVVCANTGSGFVPRNTETGVALGYAYDSESDCQNAVQSARRGIICVKDNRGYHAPYSLEKDKFIWPQGSYGYANPQTCFKQVRTATRNLICLHGSPVETARLYNWQQETFLDQNYGNAESCYSRLPRRRPRPGHGHGRPDRDGNDLANCTLSIQREGLFVQKDGRGPELVIGVSSAESTSMESHIARFENLGCAFNGIIECNTKGIERNKQALPWVQIKSANGTTLSFAFEQNPVRCSSGGVSACAGGVCAGTGGDDCGDKDFNRAKDIASEFLANLEICPQN